MEIEFVIINVSKKSKKEIENIHFSLDCWFRIFNSHLPQLKNKLNTKFTRVEMINGQPEKLKINSIIEINSN